MGSLSLPLGNMGKSTCEKSETRIPATRISANPDYQSVQIMVSLPAGLKRAV